MSNRHTLYASYVIRHRWFVLVECVRLRVPWRGLVHDLSKFLPDEWLPYANYFYGPKLHYDPIKDQGYFHKPGIDEAFDVAWLRHLHRNPHHWQFWWLREDDGGTKCLPMPEQYVREMLADWRGAGRAQGFISIGPWYAQHRRLIKLAPESRDLLHSLMTDRELEGR